MKYVVIFLFMSTGMIARAQEATPPPHIQVEGEGIVRIVPDQVQINVRIEEEGDEYADVKESMDLAANKVISFLKQFGLDSRQVKTEHMNLQKNYNYQTKTYSFQANQSLAITLKDLSKYPALMEGLFAKGVNRLDGVVFESSDMEALRSEARILAVQNARKKAEEIGQALSQKVGKAFMISESGMRSPRPLLMKTMAMESDQGGGEVFAPGELEVRVSIQAAFYLY